MTSEEINRSASRVGPRSANSPQRGLKVHIPRNHSVRQLLQAQNSNNSEIKETVQPTLLRSATQATALARTPLLNRAATVASTVSPRSSTASYISLLTEGEYFKLVSVAGVSALGGAFLQVSSDLRSISFLFQCKQSVTQFPRSVQTVQLIEAQLHNDAASPMLGLVLLFLPPLTSVTLIAQERSKAELWVKAFEWLKLHLDFRDYVESESVFQHYRSQHQTVGPIVLLPPLELMRPEVFLHHLNSRPGFQDIQEQLQRGEYFLCGTPTSVPVVKFLRVDLATNRFFFGSEHYAATQFSLPDVKGEMCLWKWPIVLAFENVKLVIGTFSGTRRSLWTEAFKWLVAKIAARRFDITADEFSKSFTIGRKLGEGAFSQVFEVSQNLTGKIMALKKMNTLDIATKKEIEILKQCKHPNLVSYHGSFVDVDHGCTCVLMDFCDGGSLLDLLKRSKEKLRERHIAYILRSTLLGLAYLHAAISTGPVIHRDVKAANILLTAAGEVKLSDFGVSTVIGIKTKQVAGSPLWMAPEALLGFEPHTKFDVWSIGITALELAQGTPPYSHLTQYPEIVQAVTNNPAPTLSNADGTWSNEFADFVSKCLTKDWEKRPGVLALLQHPFVRTAKEPATLERAPWTIGVGPRDEDEVESFISYMEHGVYTYAKARPAPTRSLTSLFSGLFPNDSKIKPLRPKSLPIPPPPVKGEPLREHTRLARSQNFRNLPAVSPVGQQKPAPVPSLPKTKIDIEDDEEKVAKTLRQLSVRKLPSHFAHSKRNLQSCQSLAKKAKEEDDETNREMLNFVNQSLPSAFAHSTRNLQLKAPQIQASAVQATMEPPRAPFVVARAAVKMKRLIKKREEPEEDVRSKLSISLAGISVEEGAGEIQFGDGEEEPSSLNTISIDRRSTLSLKTDERDEIESMTNTTIDPSKTFVLHNDETVQLGHLVIKSESRMNSASSPTLMDVASEAMLKSSDLLELGVIGRGQNGKVIKALHIPTLTFFALKSMNTHDQKTRHQVLKELIAFSKLSAEAQVLNFYGAFYRSGQIVLASEYMDCGSLQQFVQRNGALSEEMIRHIAFQAVQGLQEIHSKNHVHRDIKPDNILLNHLGNVKIADFGLWKELSGPLDVTVSFMGTMGYLSPERASAAAYSYPGDIWALGLSLIYCALGHNPLQIADYWKFIDAVVKQPSPSLPRGKFSADFCDFVDRCLVKDPDTRATAKELLDHPFLCNANVDDEEIKKAPAWQVRCPENELDVILQSVIETHFVEEDDRPEFAIDSTRLKYRAVQASDNERFRRLAETLNMQPKEVEQAITKRLRQIRSPSSASSPTSQHLSSELQSPRTHAQPVSPKVAPTLQHLPSELQSSHTQPMSPNAE